MLAGRGNHFSLGVIAVLAGGHGLAVSAAGRFGSYHFDIMLAGRRNHDGLDVIAVLTGRHGLAVSAAGRRRLINNQLMASRNHFRLALGNLTTDAHGGPAAVLGASSLYFNFNAEVMAQRRLRHGSTLHLLALIIVADKVIGAFLSAGSFFDVFFHQRVTVALAGLPIVRAADRALTHPVTKRGTVFIVFGGVNLSPIAPRMLNNVEDLIVLAVVLTDEINVAVILRHIVSANLTHELATAFLGAGRLDYISILNLVLFHWESGIINNDLSTNGAQIVRKASLRAGRLLDNYRIISNLMIASRGNHRFHRVIAAIAQALEDFQAILAAGRFLLHFAFAGLLSIVAKHRNRPAIENLATVKADAVLTALRGAGGRELSNPLAHIMLGGIDRFRPLLSCAALRALHEV